MKLRAVLLAVMFCVMPYPAAAQSCIGGSLTEAYHTPSETLQSQSILGQSCNSITIQSGTYRTPYATYGYVEFTPASATQIWVSVSGNISGVYSYRCYPPSGSTQITSSPPQGVTCLVGSVIDNSTDFQVTISNVESSVGGTSEATPTPTPTSGGGISAQDISLPFNFEVIDFDRSGPALPEIDFVDTALINQIGSIALTLFSFFNLEILGIMVVLMLALIALAWLFSFVTDTPTAGASIRHYDIMSANDAVDLAYGAANARINVAKNTADTLTVAGVRGMLESGVDPDTAFTWGVNQAKANDAWQADRLGRLNQSKSYYRQGVAAYKRIRR